MSVSQSQQQGEKSVDTSCGRRQARNTKSNLKRHKLCKKHSTKRSRSPLLHETGGRLQGMVVQKVQRKDQ